MSLNYPFWVNNFDRVRDHKQQYPLASKIFEQPVSFWYGERNGKTIENLQKSLTRLFARTAPQLPVLVVYNLPNRDMGHYSKGGASSYSNYMRFLEDFTDGLGNNEVIVIYEPDALPHTSLMSDFEAEWRIKLMKEGLATLTRSNAHVYVDIGHSNWLSPKEANELLEKVSNPRVRGFSVNVSNYRTTIESAKWANKICEHRPMDQYVIDTSRNGNGPHGNEWCNPPGRALGESPTCDTGLEKCDAYLWIKIPGESDGKANGGPRAGRFWGEMAEELVNNSLGDNK